MSLMKILIVLTLWITYLIGNNSCCNASEIFEQKCSNIRDTNVKNGGHQYCNCTYKIFRQNYTTSNLKLTNLLEKLRAWNCSQFEDECQNRNFDFNRFTFLVYERFCDELNFEKLCNKNLESSNKKFHNATSSTSNAYFGESVFASPCLQVSSYNYGHPYYEISRPVLSFCDVVWCGFNDGGIADVSPSLWPCLPDNCRAKLIFIMVFCGILALFIIIANLTVIIVIIQNPQFPTNQMIYKLSLAFADILVGIFVVPSFASTLYMSNTGTFQVIPVKGQASNPNEVLDSITNISSQNNQTANFYYPSTLPRAYIDFFGVINTFSLLNSIYILTFACIDRFSAVHKPLKYNGNYATKQAKLIAVLTWIAVFLFSSLPCFIPELGPYVIASGGILIKAKQDLGLYVSGLALFFPLIMVWVFTIGTQVSIKRKWKVNKEFSSSKQEQNLSTRRQLSITLSIMVGAFTVCIIPAIILIISSTTNPQVNPLDVKRFSLKSASNFEKANLAAALILVSNSLWNVLIYSFRNKRFREDVVTLYSSLASKLN